MYDEKTRRKGLYLRIICGIRKAELQHKPISFLVLTTSDSTAEGLNDEEKMDLVNRSFHILMTYWKQKYPNIDFINVVTNEGNGVIHALISGLPFILWTKLQKTWNQIHGSQYVHIARMKGNAQGIAGYLMSQYLANQNCLFRFKMSKNWICTQFSKHWRVIKKCSVDWTNKKSGYTKDGFFYEYYEIDKEKLVRNFKTWLFFYIKKGVFLKSIPEKLPIEVFI